MHWLPNKIVHLGRISFMILNIQGRHGVGHVCVDFMVGAKK